jgi:16S rRNA processing protein RimM
MEDNMTERILVGAISGAFGVKGEVRLKSFCAEPSAIGGYSPLFTSDGMTAYKVTITRQIPDGFSAKLSGVSTKEQADSLRGVQLYADRSQLANLPDDEFYHADLIGLEVLNTGGVVLGRVKAVLNHGAGDILEIHGAVKGGLLLPFTLKAVPTVDLKAGRIIVDPPELVADDD